MFAEYAVHIATISGLIIGFFVARWMYKPSQEFEDYVRNLEHEVDRLRPARKSFAIDLGGEDIF